MDGFLHSQFLPNANTKPVKQRNYSIQTNSWDKSKYVTFDSEYNKYLNNQSVQFEQSHKELNGFYRLEDTSFSNGYDIDAESGKLAKKYNGIRQKQQQMIRENIKTLMMNDSPDQQIVHRRILTQLDEKMEEDKKYHEQDQNKKLIDKISSIGFKNKEIDIKHKDKDKNQQDKSQKNKDSKNTDRKIINTQKDNIQPLNSINLPKLQQNIPKIHSERNQSQSTRNSKNVVEKKQNNFIHFQKLQNKLAQKNDSGLILNRKEFEKFSIKLFLDKYKK